MLSDFFYHTNQSGETVRVQAESWDRIQTAPETGQCPTIYIVILDYSYTYFGTFYRYTVTAEREGPVSQPYVVFPTSGGMQINGMANGKETSYVSRGGYSSAYTSAEIISFNTRRKDGQPDNCGSPGSCRTEFYRQGQTTHVIDYCPDIYTEPPTCCCDCCAELAQLARSITV